MSNRPPINRCTNPGSLTRSWLLILMCLGVGISYIDRVNIAQAMIVIKTDLVLTPLQQGVILSSFSWGYVIFMVLGGVLVDRLGATRVAGIAMLCWSVATALVSTTTNAGGLFIYRMLVGISEAPIFPAYARIVRDTYNPDERGRATAIFDSGAYIGTALATPLVAYVTSMYSWRVAFTACAFLGLPWLLLWQKASRASTSLSIPIHDQLKISSQFISLMRLTRHRQVAGCCIGFFCYNYAKSFFLTWMPNYLVKERGFSFLSTGFVSMLPPLCAVIGGCISGILSDRMLASGKDITLARKLPLCTGLLLGSAIGVVPFVHSSWLVVTLLCLSFGSIIAASPCIWAIPSDIAPSPKIVGGLCGLQNAFSNIAGILAPIVTGLFLSSSAGFLGALVTSAILSITGAFVYWYVVGPIRPLQLAPEKEVQIVS